MVKPTTEAIEIRDLGEMLAALCKVAQDAAGEVGASQMVETPGPAREFQTAEDGGGRT